MEDHTPLEGRRDEARIAPDLAVCAADIERELTGAILEEAKGTKEHAQSLAPRFRGGEQQAQRARSRAGGPEPVEIDTGGITR